MNKIERGIRIQQIKNEIKSLSRQLGELIHDCEHEIRCNNGCQSDDVEALECAEWGHSIAQCIHCGEQFGWFCPVSETGQCEYDKNEWCICCGEPDERK